MQNSERRNLHTVFGRWYLQCSGYRAQPTSLHCGARSVEPRNGKAMIKQNCPSRGFLESRIDESIAVEYHWDHDGHGMHSRLQASPQQDVS